MGSGLWVVGGRWWEERLKPRGPQVLRVLAFQVQKLEAILASESVDIIRRKADAAPGVGVAGRRDAIELAMEYAAGFQQAANLAHVFQHDLAAGNVLENSVRINEIERLIGELGQRGAVRGVEVGVRNIGSAARARDESFRRRHPLHEFPQNAG